MTEETLLTAARRALREFNICMEHGGLISQNAEMAMSTLDKMIRSEVVKRKANCYGCKHRIDRVTDIHGEFVHKDPNNDSWYKCEAPDC